MAEKSKLRSVYCILSLFFLINTVQSQSLSDKVGQMLMVGFNQYNDFMDTLLVDIGQRNLGGVILYGYNIWNPSQIRYLNTQLQKLATIPLFIAIDQEGGYVARLNANNGLAETYSAYTLGTIFNSEDSTRTHC